MKYKEAVQVVREEYDKMLGDLAQHMMLRVDMEHDPPRYVGFDGSFYMDDEVMELLDTVYCGNYPHVDLMQIDRVSFKRVGEHFLHHVIVEVDGKEYTASADADDPYSEVAVDVRSWLCDKASDLYNILLNAYSSAFWSRIRWRGLRKRFWEVIGEYAGQDVIVHDLLTTDDKENIYYVVATRDGVTLREEVLIDDLETGASQALDEFVAIRLPREKEELARKEEAERMTAEEKQKHESFYGFTDGMTLMEKGRVVKILDRQYRYNGVVMSRAEHVKSSIESGCTISTRLKANGSTMYCLDTTRSSYYTITKTEYDFARYLMGA